MCCCKGEGITVDYHNSTTWNELKSKHVFFFPLLIQDFYGTSQSLKGKLIINHHFFHSKLLRNQRVIAICRSDCHQAVLGSPSARCWTPGEGERERDPGAPPGLALPTSPWSRHSVPSSVFFLPWRLGNCLGKYWLYIYIWYIMIDNG